VTRTVTEGKGNGNGVLEPGEEATIWVRMRQGLDPFDKNKRLYQAFQFHNRYLHRYEPVVLGKP
jgi:hypothetical protein